MVVMVLERVSPSLRGELTRWLLEVRTGTFLGSPSALVRDRLWRLVGEKLGEGGAVLAWSDNSEQGFSLAFTGDPTRELVVYEGLQLVRRLVERAGDEEATPAE